MKAIFLTVLTFYSVAILLAQAKGKPFIIQGKITNCPENKVLLYSGNEMRWKVDTINLKQDGSFYLKTYNIKEPQRTRMGNNSIQFIDLFIAPGDNLTLTADGTDWITTSKTKQLSGIGAESNRYLFLLDSVTYARADTTKFWMLNEAGLVAYARSRRQLQDSLANQVFTVKKAPANPYFRYFEKKVRLNNRFSELYMLFNYVNEHHLDSVEGVRFLRGYADTTLLSDMYKDEYLLSDDYKYWIVTNQYLSYLLRMDCLKVPSQCNDKYRRFSLVSQVYKGQPKEYTLRRLLLNFIVDCPSLSVLAEYKEELSPYIDALQIEDNKKVLYAKFLEKETALTATQIGQPAPAFTLADNMSGMHSLQDFAGKVVYLDLWASWCHPCREETPALKTLYEKYKDDNRVKFVSIAVHDGIREWKKAVSEDKPTWLQLLDKDGLVLNAYAAWSIPRFIVINKQGKIVDFDAPRPSSGETLEALLNREIEKQ